MPARATPPRPAQPVQSLATQSFEEDLTNTLLDLRSSITPALQTLGVPPDEPQELARRLGISRNLTWKISKVLCAADLFEAIQHLPGEEGVDIFLSALGEAGVAAPALDHMRRSAARFDHIVELHSGDRATLELMLDGMGAASPERLEQSRKLAFRGNSGLWGIQARARMTTLIVAPTAGSGERLDMVLLGGMCDVRRLRPHVTWPIFYPRAYHDDGTTMDTTSADEPVDETIQDRTGLHLIPDFCSSTMPAITLRPGRNGPVCELGPGPVGNTGAFSIVFGTITRGVVSRFKSDRDEHGESSTQITMPTAALQFDLILHRSLAFGDPEASVMGRVAVPNGDEEAHPLPIGESPRELSGTPPMVGSTLVPGYERVIERAMQRGGWSLRDFRVWRLVMQYPPMHAAVRVQFALETR